MQKPKAETAKCLTMFIKLAQVGLNRTGHGATWKITMVWRHGCGAREGNGTWRSDWSVTGTSKGCTEERGERC